MASAKTYWKLGIFTLIALVGVVAAAFALGIRSVAAETVLYHTYFDETVQGLEVGAPVKVRGVTVGAVAGVRLAPDRRHVDVGLALDVGAMSHVGLDRQPLPAALRAQLSSQGITGVKLVDLDFVDDGKPPPPLPFTPADRTIPAEPSLLKSLEDRLAQTLERLPDLLGAAIASLGKVDRFLDDVHDRGVVDAVAATIGSMNGAIAELRAVVRHTDQARIPEKAARAIEDMDAAIAKVGLVLDRFDGDGGLVASTKRATDSVGDLGRTVNGSAAELDRTLRDLSDAARAVRDLADMLERDPDMLVKGRAQRKAR
jgi:ABC-type transporter Mla subunit MlaD